MSRSVFRIFFSLFYSLLHTIHFICSPFIFFPLLFLLVFRCCCFSCGANANLVCVAPLLDACQCFSMSESMCFFSSLFLSTVVALLFNIILKFDVHFQIDNCLSKCSSLRTVNITARTKLDRIQKLIKLLWKT